MRPRLAHSLARLTASAALAAALALGACGAKDPDGSDDRRPPSAAPAARPAPAAPPPAPGPDAATAPAAPPPASGAFPEACDAYRATIERLARCGDALAPDVVARLVALFERQWAGWQALPEPDRRALAGVCQSSADVVKDAAAAACDW